MKRFGRVFLFLALLLGTEGSAAEIAGIPTEFVDCLAAIEREGNSTAWVAPKTTLRDDRSYSVSQTPWTETLADIYRQLNSLEASPLIQMLVSPNSDNVYALFESNRPDLGPQWRRYRLEGGQLFLLCEARLSEPGIVRVALNEDETLLAQLTNQGDMLVTPLLEIESPSGAPREPMRLMPKSSKPLHYLYVGFLASSAEWRGGQERLVVLVGNRLINAYWNPIDSSLKIGGPASVTRHGVALSVVSYERGRVLRLELLGGGLSQRVLGTDGRFRATGLIPGR